MSDTVQTSPDFKEGDYLLYIDGMSAQDYAEVLKSAHRVDDEAYGVVVKVIPKTTYEYEVLFSGAGETDIYESSQLGFLPPGAKIPEDIQNMRNLTPEFTSTRA